MSLRVATCVCGQLRLEVQGEPARVSMCHCFDCQRRTGSAYGVQARFAREQVSVEGEHEVYERTGDSGGTVTMSFCPRCGSTVFWELDGMPGAIAIAVGAFADPSFPAPTFSVYEDRAHAWAMPAHEMEHMR